MSKYKCPDCGSSKVVYWEERIIEYEHKIRKDGKPYVKPSRKTDIGNNAYGLRCEDCRSFVSLSLYDDEEWICKYDEMGK